MSAATPATCSVVSDENDSGRRGSRRSASGFENSVAVRCSAAAKSGATYVAGVDGVWRDKKDEMRAVVVSG